MNPCDPTDRQSSVLDLMCAGLHNKQIARELGISPRTVEIHRAMAMRAIGARNAIHAAIIWHERRRAPSPATSGATRAPGPATSPTFAVWLDGTKITRNGDFFADCATPEIAQALALALDRAQILFDPAIPIDTLLSAAWEA